MLSPLEQIGKKNLPDHFYVFCTKKNKKNDSGTHMHADA